MMCRENIVLFRELLCDAIFSFRRHLHNFVFHIAFLRLENRCSPGVYQIDSIPSNREVFALCKFQANNILRKEILLKHQIRMALR